MSEGLTNLFHPRCLDSLDDDQTSFLVQFIVDSISLDDNPSRFCPRSFGVLAVPLVGVDMQKSVLNGLNQLDLENHRFFRSEAWTMESGDPRLRG